MERRRDLPTEVQSSHHAPEEMDLIKEIVCALGLSVKEEKRLHRLKEAYHNGDHETYYALRGEEDEAE